MKLDKRKRPRFKHGYHLQNHSLERLGFHSLNIVPFVHLSNYLTRMLKEMICLSNMEKEDDGHHDDGVFVHACRTP